VLIIGGGIANFTNVAETFKGIIRALTQARDILKQHGTSATAASAPTVAELSAQPCASLCAAAGRTTRRAWTACGSSRAIWTCPSWCTGRTST
jgi:hypothetical protein